ncbi:hypothetical protein Tco_1224920, partial [Tanacetum coccineum]
FDEGWLNRGWLYHVGLLAAQGRSVGGYLVAGLDDGCINIDGTGVVGDNIFRDDFKFLSIGSGLRETFSLVSTKLVEASSRGGGLYVRGMAYKVELGKYLAMVFSGLAVLVMIVDKRSLWVARFLMATLSTDCDAASFSLFTFMVSIIFKRFSAMAAKDSNMEGALFRRLRDNSFYGMNGGDVTDHIAMVLEIAEWIKMPNVEKNDLRLHEINKNTKNGLWEFYVNERTKGTIGDLDEYNEPCKENTKNTCSYTFYKPHLDAQEAKDIYKVINREYSPIPIPARRNIDNPDELCRTEEFTVVRHSIGNDEEFVIVGPSKNNTVQRTPGSMSCIYHELFNRKDRGWEVSRTR